jgi:ABC-type sugar transport system ATPase subunit
VAAITLEGVSKTWSGARRELHLAGGETGGRPSASTFGEDDGAGTAVETGDGQAQALANVHLEIRDGETLAVIGPSGCGKSTLLRVIAGLEPPDTGRVLYDGRDMAGVEPGKRGIGMVFQNYALYPHMEARGNLGFFFRMHKREREIDERVRATAEIMGVGFDELLERRPKTLSGGQQQRVAIARCIARDPRLFLLDEPLSNLDARLRTRTRVEIKRLLRRFRITTVYVTHDQVEAIALADRMAVMRRGRIEQVGPYPEVYDRPANAFVAGFVGSPPANLLPGTVHPNTIECAGGGLPLAEPWRHALTQGQDVLIGIRPEHARPLPVGESGALSGTIAVVEPLIAERAQLVHVTLTGGPVSETEVTLRVPADVTAAPGERVGLALDLERVMLFDRATGRSLLT